MGIVSSIVHMDYIVIAAPRCGAAGSSELSRGRRVHTIHSLEDTMTEDILVISRESLSFGLGRCAGTALPPVACFL